MSLLCVNRCRITAVLLLILVLALAPHLLGAKSPCRPPEPLQGHKLIGQ